MYEREITLILFVGLEQEGWTAGASTSRGKPLPLPLIVGSAQSPIGTFGPLYGYRVSTSRFAGGAASAWNTVPNAPRTTAAVVDFIFCHC